MNHVHYNSTNEELIRVTQLEVEKRELELKLKTAREAMREYISLLNEKVNQSLYLSYLALGHQFTSPKV